WDENGKISQNHSAESIRQECADSLRRLGVDAIDLYQIHWPPRDNGPQLEAAWQTLAALQKEGKVRWIGVSNFDAAQIKRAQAIAPVTSNQPPYSMIRRSIEADILPYCQQQGIGTVSYAPMASGLLTGAMTRERAASLPPDDFRSRNPEFREPKLSKNIALVERLRKVGARHGRSWRSSNSLGSGPFWNYRCNCRRAQCETRGRNDAGRRSKIIPRRDR